MRLLKLAYKHGGIVAIGAWVVATGLMVGGMVLAGVHNDRLAGELLLLGYLIGVLASAPLWLRR